MTPIPDQMILFNRDPILKNYVESEQMHVDNKITRS